MQLLKRRKPAVAEPEKAVATAPKAAPPESKPKTAAAPAKGAKAQLAPRARKADPLEPLWNTLPKFNRQVLTLSLEDGLIRAVVMNGRKVIAWGTATTVEDVPTEAGQAEAPSDGKTGSLRTLIRQMGVKYGKVVTDLPVHATIVRHLHLPKMRQGYMQDVVTSEVLDTVPFESDEIDLGWQYKKNGAGEDVLAIAASKVAIDNHVALLRKADITPGAIYAKAVALAAIANVPDALIIHFNPTQVDLVLVRGKAPVIMHRVDQFEDGSSPEAQAETVAKAAAQVVGYYQGSLTSDANMALPAIVTGQVDPAGALAQELREALTMTIMPLESSVVYPKNFSPNEYAVNLGLALADQSKSKVGSRVAALQMPSVNLLPERYFPRRIPLTPVLVFVLLALFGAASMNLSRQVETLNARAATISARLAVMQRQERDQRLNLTRVRAIENDQKAAQALADGLQAELTDLQGQSDSLQAELNTITNKAIPANSGIVLGNLNRQPTDYTINGTALSYEDVLQYAKNLRDSGLFSSAWVLQAMSTATVDSTGATQADVKVSFTIKAMPQSQAAGAATTPSATPTPTPK